MGGYVARSGVVSGELHPLEVGAVAFGGSSRLGVLIVVDLLQVDDDLAMRARAAVASAVGTSPDLVWVCATHTHSGPLPEEVAEQVVTACVSSARSAVTAAAPASVTLHRCQLEGVGGQRTGSDRRTTLPVDVLRVGDASGSLVGVVGVVPVHPTVLGADNTSVSPDLPGGVRRALAPDVWSLVATGAAGDVSTRPQRREQTPAEVDRLGSITAACLLDAVASPALAVATDVLGGRVESVPLVPADPAAAFRSGAVDSARRVLAEAEAAGDARRTRDATVVVQGAELAARVTESGDPAAAVPCATAYLDLGGVRLLGLGGEPFLDLAPGGSDVLLGYANGYAGYLPTRAAFDAAAARPDHPEYEVLISRVAPGEPERALAAALAG
jgi:hypothetical protein